ncbi:hypothetical protein JCM30237_01630 [Halolamina litorea]|uniref:Uncharacterized protein n=1 Tax=Halolamina litorea TaxID=1515593 RepID=A0ABD6BTB1_9EURY|nr:hypothetical protein [Halolamina litorea]
MTPTFLAELRADDRRRLAATALAAVVGLALALGHWAGLLVAGALVALPQRSVVRGVVAGLALGSVAVGGFLAAFALAGTLGPALSMGQPLWLALAIGLFLPPFGSLLRGVV